MRHHERVITRYECPLGSCGWTREDPGPDASEGTGETIEQAAANAVRAYLLRAETAIREHLETHSLLEWAQEVMRLRGELDREKRTGARPTEREPEFDYARSRAKALEIHAAACSAPGWCNYGAPEADGLEDDEALPWPERQERAGLRLAGYRHCQEAVGAENAAGDAIRREDGLPPREHDRAQQVAEASAEIGVELNRLQRENGLTTTEMLQATGSWQMSCLKYMLRRERHPDDPGEPADLE